VGRSLILGSRASALALAQTRLVVTALEALHPGVVFEIRCITTRGDQVLDRALSKVGGKGLFVKEIEEALLERDIDLAVHSLKDLPSEQPAGLLIAAVPERADPRDALVTRDGSKLADLPPGARVGTSSLRRAAQLRALRPDPSGSPSWRLGRRRLARAIGAGLGGGLAPAGQGASGRSLEILDIRGNVDTRLRKLDQGQYDAIVLAAAGLARLGLLDRVAQFFDPEVFLPAPGQGALAIEVRADDAATQALVAPLDHIPTRLAVEAERAFLRRLGAGCQVPVAAYARLDGANLTLYGMLADQDGANVVYDKVQGPASQAVALGNRLADDLMKQKHKDR
jgi:hydroxymethylbilane synthase